MTKDKSTKPLNHKEIARLGAITTNSRYDKATRSQWAKKGPQAIKAKYGDDYFKKMALQREKKRREKEEAEKNRPKPLSELLASK